MARATLEVAEPEPGRLPVHEVRRAGLDVTQDRVFLLLRDPARLDRGVEVLLRVRDDGIDQPVDRLVLRLGDLGERLAALELRTRLVLGHAELAWRGVGRASWTAEHVRRPARAGAAGAR